MSHHPLPADLSEYPIWRLLGLLYDIERDQGAKSDDARRVAAIVAERLDLASVREEAAHATR
jgi:hypothetical protein